MGTRGVDIVEYDGGSVTGQVLCNGKADPRTDPVTSADFSSRYRSMDAPFDGGRLYIEVQAQKHHEQIEAEKAAARSGG